jgi:hypothetical protein
MRDAAPEGHRRGACGVPAYLLGGNPFWDNDRLVVLRHDPTTLGKRHAAARWPMPAGHWGAGGVAGVAIRFERGS